MKHALDDSTKIRLSNNPSLECYLKDLAHYPPLSTKEEQKAFKEMKNGSKQDADKLITSNLRFVVSIATEYQGRGLPLSDLIEEGNLGLFEARKRYDETRGFRFITYAVWWIRQAILSALKQTPFISMPKNRLDDFDAIAKHWGLLTQVIGHTTTIEEIAQHMNVSTKRAHRALQSRAPVLSLDKETRGEPHPALIESLASPDSTPEELMCHANIVDILECALNTLEERERQVIRLYFQFGCDADVHSLEKIGKLLGVTRERVRQIKNAGLCKLERYFRLHYKIKNYEEASW